MVGLFAQPQSFSLGNKLPEHCRIALKYANEREIKPNRSAVIDSANSYVGNRLGDPYCCAFVCWTINKSQAKSPKIKTGLSTKFKSSESFSALDVISGKRYISSGDVLTWQRGSTIFGHTGLSLENWKSNKGLTIQANTKFRAESSEGDGIFIKSASLSALSYFRIVRITPVRY